MPELDEAELEPVELDVVEESELVSLEELDIESDELSVLEGVSVCVTVEGAETAAELGLSEPEPEETVQPVVAASSKAVAAGMARRRIVVSFVRGVLSSF